MISIVIFMLTTLSGAAVGAYFSDRLSQRCAVISAYISLFRNMTAYVTYNGYKLDEMLKAQCKTSRCYISDKLIAVCESGGNISEEWDACVNTSGCLKAEERNILSELGRNIGKSNTEGETAVLALAQTRLESVLESASEEKKRKGRLYRTLGIMLGAAVGIMLI